MTVSHAAHLLGVIFLCGLWLPIWLLQCWDVDRRNRAAPYRCQTCGGAVYPTEPRFMGGPIGFAALLVGAVVLVACVYYLALSG